MMDKLNLYQKIQKCRVELQQSNLKKSGNNKYAGFKYYELADFIPKVNELFDKYKLFSQFTLAEGTATLEIFDTESDKSIVFTMPTAELVIKGSNAIQSLGGTNTYLKRYLYLNALEIVEPDTFDATSGKDKPTYSKKSEEKETTDLMQQMIDLANETNTDYESLRTYYKVDSNTDMTLEQLQDCVKNLKIKKQKITMLRESGQSE